LDGNESHHYVYYNVGDNTDKGSIIDYLQKRRNLNLGEVRKELRPWINGSRSYIPPTSTPKLTPSTPDLQTILTQIQSFQTIPHHPYLTQRGISQPTTDNDRFQGTIYTDSRNNVIFLYQDLDGLCGYDIRNQNFKGFSKGGTKGLWFSQTTPNDTKLVICESPIDCLSHYRLFHDPNTRYIATGGTISEKQRNLIRTAFAEIHRQGGEIVISMDNDEAGKEMARELSQLTPENARIKGQVPKNYKDWNEALQGQIRREREAREQERKRQQDRGFSR
jgi:hypothetical protein